jgi:hypothetical protein
MPRNFLEHLSHIDVPPRPADLPRSVHQRVNARLLAAQLIELTVIVMPLALVHFTGALAGAVAASLKGEKRRSKES